MRAAQGDLAGALAAYEAGQAIRERLAAVDPGNAEWQRDLSISWIKMGDVRQALGDHEGALAAYTASQEISERLPGADPANARWQGDLSISWERLAAVREEQGDRAGALDAWRRALAVSERLAEASADDVAMRTAPVVHLAGVTRTFDPADPAARAQAAAALDRAPALLRPLADAGRLDTGRQGWIAWIEEERRVFDRSGRPRAHRSDARPRQRPPT